MIRLSHNTPLTMSQSTTFIPDNDDEVLEIIFYRFFVHMVGVTPTKRLSPMEFPVVLLFERSI